jgi:hypothetical protein
MNTSPLFEVVQDKTVEVDDEVETIALSVGELDIVGGGTGIAVFV